VKTGIAALFAAVLLFAPPLVRADGSQEALRYYGLGNLTRPVTGCSADAQGWFDQGLAFMYAFNHDEAIRSFRQAAAVDENCAMAWWGIAVANGPHINNAAVPEHHAAEAVAALARAEQVQDRASAVERELIAAQKKRFVLPSPADRSALDQAYADAMAAVWKSHPTDADVGVLYAEALADLHPWDLWTAEGEPKNGALEVITALDAVLALDPKHPLANHLYIHALEASPYPDRAIPAADVLRDLQPGLGHMVHMPSHIDIRTARWADAIVANRKAIDADRAYQARAPEPQFYRLYIAHNYHMLTFAAMMSGRSEQALTTIRAMVADVPADFFRENSFVDGLMVMPLEVQMRFGRWDEVLAEPDYPDYVPISRTMRHYARAVAYAAKDDFESARKEQAAFAESRTQVPAEAVFGTNPASAILAIAEQVMNGEILYRSGNTEAGLAALREGVRREDAMFYDEPPDWIQPVRHPFGAALLQSGHYAEAEAVFRADLKRWPGNGWGLYGLARALELQGRRDEAAETMKAFDAVWDGADIRIKSPCLCLPGV
jgi:tetratricopeptide (TPR) repeat protein